MSAIKKHFRKLLYFLLFLFIANTLLAQNPASYYSTGVLFLTDAQYAQLPRPNWDSLSKYAPGRGGSTAKLNGLTMLVNPPIGDQGTQGSCVGWASGYTAMGVLTYAKYNCWDVARRSPGYVYNQIKAGSCGAGSYVKDALNLLVNQGDCSWNLMPYVNSDCATQPSTAQRNEAAQNKASKWAAFNKNDYVGMKKAVDLGYPVVVAFNVTTSFDNMWNSSGIWTTNSGSSRGGHATCIVGYDDSKGMFKVQNQWGNGGDQGFFWVTYNLVINNCLKEAYVVYGTSNRTPLSIDGSNPLCTSGNYTVLNMPTGSTVIWTSSPAGILTGGTPGNPTSFTKSGSGTVMLTAQVNTCSNTQTINTTINVGAPGIPSITNISVGPYPQTTQIDVSSSVPNISNVSSYTFLVDGSVAKSGTGAPPPVVTLNGGGVGNHTVILQTSNACGTSSTSSSYTRTSTHKYTISPNPATSIITVILNKDLATKNKEVVNLDEITQIVILDISGQVKKSISYSGSQTSANVSVTDLHPGYYIVEVHSKESVEKLNVLIKK